MNIRINKKYGIVFWITGLSGSGKSSIGKNIFNQISKTYGPTILIHGDNIRKIFKLKKYDKQNRKLYGYMYSDLCKYLQNQKINIIITVGGLFHDLHKYNKKKIKNYCEIFIKSSLKKIIEYKKKKFTKKKKIYGELILYRSIQQILL